MDRRKFLSSITGLSLWPLFSGLSSAQAQSNLSQTLRINYYHEWQPISYSQSGKPAQGILINILDAILRDEMGINVVHQGLPWKRAQYDVQMGKADALCAFPSKERRSYLNFSEEMALELEVVFFYHKDANIQDQLAQAQSFADLKGLAIGELYANDWAKKVLKGHEKITFAPDLSALMRVLARKRVEVVMAPDLIGQYILSELDLQDDIGFVRKKFIGRKIPMYLGIRKDFQNGKVILARFDKTLAEAKQSGRYAELLKEFSSY